MICENCFQPTKKYNTLKLLNPYTADFCSSECEQQFNKKMEDEEKYARKRHENMKKLINQIYP